MFLVILILTAAAVGHFESIQTLRQSRVDLDINPGRIRVGTLVFLPGESRLETELGSQIKTLHEKHLDLCSLCLNC